MHRLSFLKGQYHEIFDTFFRPSKFLSPMMVETILPQTHPTVLVSQDGWNNTVANHPTVLVFQDDWDNTAANHPTVLVSQDGWDNTAANPSIHLTIQQFLSLKNMKIIHQCVRCTERTQWTPYATTWPRPRFSLQPLLERHYTWKQKMWLCRGN